MQYVAKNKSWQYSHISFSEYQHSYNYEKVGREFALKYTDSNLPDNMFNQYKQIIINNRNGLEK